MSGQPDEQGAPTGDHGGLRGAVEALVARWELEGMERGPEDTLLTNGVVGMLRAALAASEKTQVVLSEGGPVTSQEQADALGLGAAFRSMTTEPPLAAKPRFRAGKSYSWGPNGATELLPPVPLAARPVPEPAQVGEVGAVAALLVGHAPLYARRCSCGWRYSEADVVTDDDFGRAFAGHLAAVLVAAGVIR